MNLHHDKELFKELIIGATNKLHIPANIIEKDYFVTLTLSHLSSRLKNIVFKGGTSLTKCYQVLDRFSEDIDISYFTNSGTLGNSQKKELKHAVVTTLQELDLTITNLEQTKSRRNYNCYRTCYPSIYEHSPFLNHELVLETYVASLPFPIVTKMVDNYLYRFLKEINRVDIAETYDLTPFPITTQAIERTLIDKVFAICDYYMENKTNKHSRHLYDIHKIYTNIDFSPEFTKLIGDVRSLRSNLSVCPSAQPEVNINQVLQEIVDSKVYKKDYNEITHNLLFSPLSYDEAIQTIINIINLRIF